MPAGEWSICQLHTAGMARTVRTEKISHALLVPTMLAGITEQLSTQSADAPMLRSLAYGGAKMPLPVLERAIQLFPTTDFVNAYGLTETSSTIAVLGPEDHRAALHGDPVARARLASVGRLIPGIEVQIRGSDGAIHAEAAGDISVRGPQVSGEYRGYGSVLDDDGWFATRDRGWIDDDGYLFVEGRSDDTIIRGGENIAPAEIEDVLMAHDAVIDAAVFGVPDERWGQDIAAAVVLRPGRTPKPRTSAAGRARGYAAQRPRRSLFSATNCPAPPPERCSPRTARPPHRRPCAGVMTTPTRHHVDGDHDA